MEGQSCSTEFCETAESGVWEMEAMVPRSRLKGDPLGSEGGRCPAHGCLSADNPDLAEHSSYTAEAS